MDLYFGIFLIISTVILRFADTTEITVCYEWQATPEVELRCNTDEKIHIRSVSAWKQPTNNDNNRNFCSNPYVDRTIDCYNADKVNENNLFWHCNFRDDCRRVMSFVSNDECVDSGYEGQRYFHIDYECLPTRRNGNPVLFKEIQDTQPTTFTSSSFFHLTTESYPSYANIPKQVCLLTLGPYSELAISTLELRSYRSSQCPFKLYVNDNGTQYTQCASEVWNTSLSRDIVYTNSVSGSKSIQIAFEKLSNADNVQGKVWLRFQSFSTVSAGEENQGIRDLYCDFSFPIWPRPYNQPATTTTTTTTTTSTTITTPATSTHHVSSSNLPTDAPPLTNAGPTSEPDEVKAEKNKDSSSSSLLPVIGGVVAGGVVILLVIIIVIVLLVRRYQINHQPPKSLEVIDAWDDASTLSRPEKPVSHLSNGSTAYDPSMTTTTTIPPYDSSPRQSYMINGELYAEIPELQVPKSTRNGQSNGYIFEDDLYSSLPHSNSNKVLLNGNGVVLAGSLDRRKVHELYSKPMKRNKRKPALSTSTVSSGGFDNPAMGGDIYESAHQYELRGDEDIYGYSTSLA